MNCQNSECDAQQGWIRSRVLSRPGFYLESEWYCGEACLQQAIIERLKKRKQIREKSFQSLLRLKLGHILLESGAITRSQLDKAIETQQKQQPSERLGAILKTLEFVKERDVTLALSRQYGLPLVNLKNQKISDVVIKMVPLEIVRESTFFPLEYDSYNNALVLVTYDPADISNMITLRSILKCEVTIYLGDESAVKELKESFCRRAADQARSEKLLAAEIAEDLPGLASFIVSRAKTLNATTLNVKYFNKLIWARFTINRQMHDVIVNAA
jgi:type IV pilus assembly protein PilB